MKRKNGDVYKIACLPSSSMDALRMLLFLKKEGKKLPLSAFCMGKKGGFTRILGKVYGSFLSYASVQEDVLGVSQLSLDEMVNTFYFHRIDTLSSVYALIGDPVDQSIGHIFWNKLFDQEKRNSVYVKIELKEEGAVEVFCTRKKVGAQGS